MHTEYGIESAKNLVAELLRKNSEHVNLEEDLKDGAITFEDFTLSSQLRHPHCAMFCGRPCAFCDASRF